MLLFLYKRYFDINLMKVIYILTLEFVLGEHQKWVTQSHLLKVYILNKPSFDRLHNEVLNSKGD